MNYKNIFFSIAVAIGVIAGLPNTTFAAAQDDAPGQGRPAGVPGHDQPEGMMDRLMEFLQNIDMQEVERFIANIDIQRGAQRVAAGLADGVREGFGGQQDAEAAMRNFVRAILDVLQRDGGQAFHGLFEGGGAGFLDGMVNAMNAGRLGQGDFGRNFENVARHFQGNGQGRAMFNDLWEAMFAQAGQNIGNAAQNAVPGINQAMNNLGEGLGNLGEGMGDMWRNAADGQADGARHVIGEIRNGVINFLWTVGPTYAFQVFLACGAVSGGYYGTKALVEYLSKPKPALLLNARGGNGYWAWFKSIFVTPDIKKIDMVFSPELEQRLKRVAVKLQTTRKAIAMGRDITFGNILLWGPPGTGKTMFAEKLAEESGMDFGKISGASLSQFNEGQAITEIDKLWVWGEQSPNGLVILIDEADALFVNRRELKGEDLKTISHLLAKTGTESKKVILIMTSNYKERLDEAVYSRVSDSVEMPLPNKQYREKVLIYHIRKKLFNEKSNGNPYVQRAKQVLTPAKVGEIAGLTEGLSNRTLYDIVNGIYALSLERDAVTPNIVDTVVQDNLMKMASSSSYPAAAAVAA